MGGAHIAYGGEEKRIQGLGERGKETTLETQAEMAG